MQGNSSYGRYNLIFAQQLANDGGQFGSAGDAHRCPRVQIWQKHQVIHDLMFLLRGRVRRRLSVYQVPRVTVMEGTWTVQTVSPKKNAIEGVQSETKRLAARGQQPEHGQNLLKVIGWNRSQRIWTTPKKKMVPLTCVLGASQRTMSAGVSPVLTGCFQMPTSRYVSFCSSCTARSL